MNSVIVASAKRTAVGDFCGGFSEVSAPELGSAAIESAISDADVDSSEFNETIMGCVLSAGLGQAPARQAAIGAGIPASVPATTVNKMCGSGMKAAMLAHDDIALGNSVYMVAGGMENMTRSPRLLPKSRSGARIGDFKALDHMFLDGLEDAYEQGRLMGTFAEDCASAYQFTRQDQDEFAKSSLRKAQFAASNGFFKKEIQPVQIRRKNGLDSAAEDERPNRVDPDKISRLKPAFRDNGTVTAANSSSISDGAAAMVLADEGKARKHGLPVRARIAGHASFAQSPSLFTTAPIYAARSLLQKLSWREKDVDLWEVNEAFAVVAMAFARELGIPSDRINVNGGACALGHPIGASGARIIVTLLHAMERNRSRRGVASICIGGGEATAIALEIPQNA